MLFRSACALGRRAQGVEEPLAHDRDHALAARLAELGDADQAIVDYSDSIRIAPNETYAYVNRGIVLYTKKDNNEGAIADFNSALKLKPCEVSAWINRGLVYKRKGDLDQSIKDLTDALKCLGGNLTPVSATPPANPSPQYLQASQNASQAADAYYQRGLVYIDKASRERKQAGQMYDLASTIVSPKLAQVKGVGQVSIGGSSLPAVRVEINPTALAKYRIGLESVRAGLAAANANTPKGAIEVGDLRYQIYTNDQARTAALVAASGTVSPTVCCVTCGRIPPACSNIEKSRGRNFDDSASWLSLGCHPVAST